jgi:hypothetical protein
MKLAELYWPVVKKLDRERIVALSARELDGAARSALILATNMGSGKRFLLLSGV